MGKLDPDKIYDIDLKMKFRLDDLFMLGDKYNIENDIVGLYNVLNCIQMRIVNLMDKKEKEIILGLIKEIDGAFRDLSIKNRHKPLTIGEFVKIKPLINEWNIKLHNVCIKNKFWFKKFKTDEDRLDEMKNVEEGIKDD